jgi:hypothetical protein
MQRRAFADGDGWSVDVCGRCLFFVLVSLDLMFVFCSPTLESYTAPDV